MLQSREQCRSEGTAGERSSRSPQGIFGVFHETLKSLMFLDKYSKKNKPI
jgi:hypothetical protein